MPKAVYFVRRVGVGNQNYSYAGTSSSPDPVTEHRKVLKDWLVENSVRLGVAIGDQLAIKNQTKRTQWGHFTVTSSGQVRFLGWQ